MARWRRGRSNEGQLAGLTGRWRTGVVRGRLTPATWGVHRGFSGLIPDAAGGPVEVHVFESEDLPTHWARLDAFEGESFRRVVVTVETEDGPIEACAYQVLPAPSAQG